MRKIGTVAAVLGLTALGLAVPAASAQATAQGPGCMSKWPGRDGYVRAWDGYDCSGALLGATQGNDPNWDDGVGPFANDLNVASSVMNSGTIGGKDVVAFYWNANYNSQSYGCLAPGEKYADSLADNTYSGGSYSMDDSIASHAWVTASACAPGTWIA